MRYPLLLRERRAEVYDFPVPLFDVNSCLLFGKLIVFHDLVKLS